jgi:hypothetical protein
VKNGKEAFTAFCKMLAITRRSARKNAMSSDGYSQSRDKLENRNGAVCIGPRFCEKEDERMILWRERL